MWQVPKTQQHTKWEYAWFVFIRYVSTVVMRLQPPALRCQRLLNHHCHKRAGAAPASTQGRQPDHQQVTHMSHSCTQCPPQHQQAPHATWYPAVTSCRFWPYFTGPSFCVLVTDSMVMSQKVWLAAKLTSMG